MDSISFDEDGTPISYKQYIEDKYNQSSSKHELCVIKTQNGAALLPQQP